MYIDESSINNYMSKIYGYGPRRKQLYLSTPPNKMDLSTILAISREKVLGFRVIKDLVKGDTFESFIADLIHEYPEIMVKENKYFIFLDNVPIHKSKKISPLLNKLPIVYNAGYSLFLTPIEEIFALVKYHLRKKESLTTEDLIANLIRSVSAITTSNLKACFRRTLFYFEQAL